MASTSVVANTSLYKEDHLSGHKGNLCVLVLFLSFFLSFFFCYFSEILSNVAQAGLKHNSAM